MDSDGQFWIRFWFIAGTVLIVVIGLGVLSGYLNVIREASYTDKGLEQYSVTRCLDVTTLTEWHQPGWTPSQQHLELKEK